MKRIFRNFLISLMSLLFIINMPVNAASNMSADEAVNWVKSNVGNGFDFTPDGRMWCVELILAYYGYLGQEPVRGDAIDFSWNSLPEGWIRIEGGQPQKGDILIYSSYYHEAGHVGIYESDYSTYHQSFAEANPYNPTEGVKHVTSHYTNIGGVTYWGLIRPNFKATPSYSWKWIDNKWFLQDENQVNYTGWFKENNIWYYLKPDGVMAANEMVGSYYLNNSGEWIPDKWVLNSTGWWYKHGNGSYTTNGWELIKGKWYRFDNRGYMQVGWVLDNGYWYYLKPSGAMAANETIDGYYVNARGEWVK